jgi:hypothetical protein
MTEQQPAAAADVGEAFAEAYRNYSGPCKEAWRPEEVQEGIERAFVDYVRALLQAGGDAMKRFEAQVNYWKELQDAWLPTETRQRLHETYTAYVRALQAVSAQLHGHAASGTALGCQARLPRPGGTPKS